MLYEQALDCGISVEAFWYYSPMEIYDACESFYRRKLESTKQSIMQDFIMAEVRMRFLTRKEDQDVPHPWDYYPELFADDKKVFEEQKIQEEQEEYKIARKAYIAEFNRRRQQG